VEDSSSINMMTTMTTTCNATRVKVGRHNVNFRVNSRNEKHVAAVRIIIKTTTKIINPNDDMSADRNWKP
jgi:hypothetical protein